MFEFATTAPIAAVLDVPAGRVEFLATDRTTTVVDVQPADPSKARDVTAAEQTTVNHTDGVLRIHTPAPTNHFKSTGAVAVTVRLPAGSRVEARSAAAELRTVGRLGDVAFDGAYRQITIDEAASVHLTAVDGDVEIGHLTGPAQVSTNRGDIRITEAVRGKLELRTQYGAITVGATAGASATLDAGTSYGRVSNALKNNGTPELEIHATTSHGDIVASSL